MADNMATQTAKANRAAAPYLGISTHKITKCRNWDLESPKNSGRGWRLFEGVGMVVYGADSCGNPDAIGGGKRGTVGGWSTASRRRMREYLITHSAPEGWQTLGLTVTVPGIAPSEPASTLHHDHITNAWRCFGQTIKRKGWGMVWRLELQGRKMPHYHALLVTPSDQGPERLKALLWRQWAKQLDKMPAPHHVAMGTVVSKQGKTLHVWGVWGRKCYTEGPEFRRSLWAGASEHCIDLKADDGSGAWLRYLQDHSTKSKQEQTANAGRHWGVVGRGVFVDRESLGVEALDKKSYYRVRRWLRRLRSPVVWDDKHQRKRLRKLPPGHYAGARVVFGSTDTYKRMILHAHELRQSELHDREKSSTVRTTKDSGPEQKQAS